MKDEEVSEHTQHRVGKLVKGTTYLEVLEIRTHKLELLALVTRPGSLFTGFSIDTARAVSEHTNRNVVPTFLKRVWISSLAYICLNDS